MKTVRKTKKSKDNKNHILDLKEVIQTIAMKNDLDPKSIIETIKEVIKGDLSDIIDIPEANIKVETDEDFKIKFFIVKKIVADKKEYYIEITPEECQESYKIDSPVIGEEITLPLDLSKLERSNIILLNRIILGKLKGIKKESLYKEYKQKENTIVGGVFLRKLNKDMIISLANAEGRLSLREQVWTEWYQQGDAIKVYIKSVEMNMNNQLIIELSRKDPRMVLKLFENEVQEMADGIIKVKSIVRDAGQKTKMAVYSTRAEVDPVGSCIGLYGNRIKSVMKELKRERIDMIHYSENIREYISKAINPGKVVKVLLINEKNKEALVVVEDSSYPLAIGRNGINVKLASQLVGWDLSVRTQTQMEKHPEILKVFSKIDSLFVTNESNLEKLTDIDEKILVKFLNAGINTVEELYDKSLNELEKIEGVSKADAKIVRSFLDEMVEVVESEEDARKLYREEMEDEIQGIDTDEEILEEIQQVEFIVCPSCNFEFEYADQVNCPSCGVEFEFE